MFDGVCNLCNALTQFVIKRDPAARFRFVALQSERGQSLLRRFGLPADSLDTFVIIADDRAYLRSTAALQVLRRLGFPWSPLYGFIVIPEFIRDSAYGFIARHRYRWFGHRETCMIPTPEIKSRFLS